MIKTILLFLLVLFLAWFTLDYFSIALPFQEITKVKSKHQVTTKAQEASGIDVNISKAIHTETIYTLSKLLEQNRFYNAITYYLENITTDNLGKIERYLTSLANTNPAKALEYMQALLDSVPESKILKLMIKTYITQGDLVKAIELIIQDKEDYTSDKEDKRLATQLREVSTKHIDSLLERNEFAQLITFLEEMIAYDSADNFYKFRLAQLYMNLDKVSEARTILDELQYDEVYEQNVKSILNVIEKEKDEQYKYAIPLQRHGEHYVVNMLLDGSFFTLMLDTGATYILLDEEKASMLEVLRDDLVLQTVGNDVNARLANVKEMQMGNLTLSNIEVTTAPFKRNGIDGLLGMNFFRQFSFLINQEQGVLYLNPK